MISHIAIASIACVDSFFIALLAGRRKQLRAAVAVASPALHVVFCLVGMLIEQAAGSVAGRGLWGVVVLAVLAGGVYLAAAYRPGRALRGQFRDEHALSVRPVVILILFCALDALVPGFVYGYWQTGYGTAAVCMGAMNAAAVLGAMQLCSRTLCGGTAGQR